MAPAPVEGRVPADFAKRAIAGVVMALVAGLVIVLGGWYLVAVLMLVVVLAAGEWAALTLQDSRKRYAVLGMVLLPLAILAGTHQAITAWRGTDMALVGGALGAVLLLVSGWLIRRVGGWSERRWAVLGILYLGVPAVVWLALRDLPDGLHLVLWLVAVVVCTDVFAYLVGRTVGGPKLAPRISPGKTRSGLAGGMLAAAVAGALLAGWVGWGWFQAGLAGAVLALVAQTGDLFESAMKRRAGVKDSGHLIPGHGGVLDRFDGFLFAAPVFALLVAIARTGA
ncbi:MAG: phosphatidate cytidylyltransferase [Geminicoccaceae bacterium]